MDYLKNGICNFKLIGRSKFYKEGKNIISMCLFKLPQSYKNFDIYINGLKTWISLLEKIKSNFIIRIFIDHNILNDKEIMSVINSSKFVEPVLFLCADYVLNKYHQDLFSTLIRFFPLFDFQNNDARSLLIVDIDLNLVISENFLIFYKYVLTNHDKINNFSFYTNFYETFLNNKEPYLYAGILFKPKKIKYQKKYILDFIQFENKLKYNNKYYQRVDKGLTSKNKADRLNKTRNKQFRFGIDETFLNEYFFKKCVSDFDCYELQNFNNILYYLTNYNKSKLNKIIINKRDYTKEFEQSIYKITKKKLTFSDFEKIKDKYLYSFNLKYFYCLNHKYKNCIDDFNIKDNIFHNLELRDVLKDFKNKIPQNSNVYKILNSEILNLDKFAYFLKFKFLKKGKKNIYDNFEVIYNSKK